VILDLLFFRSPLRLVSVVCRGEFITLRFDEKWHSCTASLNFERKGAVKSCVWSRDLGCYYSSSVDVANISGTTKSYVVLGTEPSI
jgi:hypothetical protein